MVIDLILKIIEMCCFFAEGIFQAYLGMAQQFCRLAAHFGAILGNTFQLVHGE
jgi:hypothetical protein